MNTQIKKQVNDLNTYHTKADIQMTNKHMKRCPTAQVTRKISNQSNSSTRMSKSDTESIKCWCECGATGMLIHCYWECKNGTSTLKGILAVPYKNQHTLTMLSNNLPPRYLTENVESLYPHKNLQADICNSFMHNCPKLEAIKLSFRR